MGGCGYLCTGRFLDLRIVRSGRIRSSRHGNKDCFDPRHSIGTRWRRQVHERRLNSLGSRQTTLSKKFTKHWFQEVHLA